MLKLELASIRNPRLVKKKIICSIRKKEKREDQKSAEHIKRVEWRQEKTQEELKETRKELTKQNKAFIMLGKKSRKEKNEVLNIARERYRDKERELREKHKQQVSELMEEIEIQKEARIEAEDRVREMELDLADAYVDLFGENL